MQAVNYAAVPTVQKRAREVEAEATKNTPGDQVAVKLTTQVLIVYDVAPKDFLYIWSRLPFLPTTTSSFT